MAFIYIEFEDVGKIFVCENKKGINLRCGDFVIVETERGKEFAKVIKVVKVERDKEDLKNAQTFGKRKCGGCDKASIENCKKKCHAENCGKCEQSLEQLKQSVNSNLNLLRRATKEDMQKKRVQRKEGKLLIRKLQRQADNLGLDIKILNVDYTIDKEKMLIDFVSEERVDFRQFVKELANEYKIKIELRQIGGRDEAKKVGGIGPCGRVCCCNYFLRDFDKVAIKMAKNQNISLNPNKINGLCGKLMCCLAYENETYEALNKAVPRVGYVVQTELGEGIVMYNDILRQQSTVKLTESEEYKVFDVKDLKF